MKTSKLQSGFVPAYYTESLILLAILGILASIVIPIYQAYLIRNHVVESLQLAETAKATVEKNASMGKPFNAGWIAPNATEYVASKAYPTEMDLTNNVYSGVAIDPRNGIITLTYTHEVDQNSPTLLLIPIINNALPVASIPYKTTIRWECHSANTPANALFPDLLGTLPPKYAPEFCR